MEYLINLSRKLTEHLLNGRTTKLDKEYFYVFSVSKFILLKESLIKKVTTKISKSEETTVIYFNNAKNQKYIPIILELYEYIKKNGTYTIKKDDRISLTTSTTDKDELASALWIMNKLRDSIVHGQYSFDFKNDAIVIDNEDPNNSYKLKCSIPLVLLNKVSFFIQEIKYPKEYDKELLIKYYRYLQQLSTYYDIDLKYKYNNYFLNSDKYKFNDNKLKINYIDNNKLNFDYISSNKYIEKNYYDDASYYNYMSKSSSSKHDSKIKYQNLTPEIIQKVISEMNLKELDSLANLIVQYHPKNAKETEIIRKLLSQYKFIITHKKQLEKQIEEYDKKTRRLIEEMHEILGIKNKNRIIDSIPALYNYMCLSFSIEPEIDYSFLSTEGLDISFDENYQNIVNGIKKKCEEFNTSLEKLIKQYNNNSNEQFRHSLMEKLAEFYSDMISKYYKRNKAITTSIRNSIEHGNFSSDNNGNIKLVDLPNQHDKSTIKFTCDATVETLYQFTNQINDLSLKDTYTLDKFFGELHKMIPDDLYEKITKRLNDLSNIAFGKDLDTSKSLENMYYEALVTVISAHSIKRS